MRRRGYLDFTPAELRARRIVFFGLALLAMPPLLTLCHIHQFLCLATWDGTFASLVALAPLFPWMAGVALLMLVGFGMAVLGGILLLVAIPASDIARNPTPAIALAAHLIRRPPMTMRRILLAGTAALFSLAALQTAHALNPQPLPPSPEWTQALPDGPVAGTKITEEYAKLVARDAYFWAWPLVNV
jgi:hypothetical protein